MLGRRQTCVCACVYVRACVLRGESESALRPAMKDDDWTCQIVGDIKSRKQNPLDNEFSWHCMLESVCVCVWVCVLMHVFMWMYVCVFVFTPVGSVIFAPNYLRHESTVGALPWQPAVGRMLCNGSMSAPELSN